MTKPFDATLKDILEEAPADWLALAGCHARDIAVIDSDVATISGFEGVCTMEESFTYQALMQKGRAEGQLLGQIDEAQARAS